MGTLTIRVPDATHERLKQLAKSRGVSINKLIEELSAAALAEFDVETRFRIRAARGRAADGLRLLAKVDSAPPAGPGDAPVARQPAARYKLRRAKR